MTSPKVTATAHTDCDACDASAAAALAHARTGGRLDTFSSISEERDHGRRSEVPRA